MNSRKNPSVLTLSRSATLAASLMTSLVASLTSAGCASIQSRNASESSENSYSARESDELDSARNTSLSLSPEQKDQRIRSLEGTILGLNSKIQELESKLQASIDRSRRMHNNTHSISERQSNDTNSAPHSRNVGTKPSVSNASNDPEAGFTNDADVRSFRQSKLLLDQEKYPEAILSLSSFIERNPRHPLAGSAQFWIAESYYHQGDLTVAAQEYRKVLSDYPFSSRVSYALARLSSCEASLGKPAEAGHYRTQFEGLFPLSPAHSLLGQVQPSSARSSSPTLPSSETPTAPTVEIPATAPSFGDYSTELDGPPSTEGR